MIHSDWLSVLQAKTREDLHAELVRVTRALGFDNFSAMVVVDHGPRETEFITVDNTPAAYQASFSSLVSTKRDPVMQHCRTSGVPILWDRSTYLDVNQGDKWEEQAQFGYASGIAFAMHLPEGVHFQIGMDRDRPFPSSALEVARVAADFQLFAVHAHEAALSVLSPERRKEETLPNLTPRELECLRWTMEGKTAWELGRILGIAEKHGDASSPERDAEAQVREQASSGCQRHAPAPHRVAQHFPKRK